jgi:hypothetical protein
VVSGRAGGRAARTLTAFQTWPKLPTRLPLGLVLEAPRGPTAAISITLAERLQEGAKRWWGGGETGVRGAARLGFGERPAIVVGAGAPRG